VKYSIVAASYGKMESTSGRIELTRIFADLLMETPKDELSMLVYLSQGKLRPDYEGVELGVAEKLALRALATASGRPAEAVSKIYNRLGDIGSAADELLKERSQGTLYSEPLTLKRVYETLLKIARQAGAGSVELKQKELVSLLNDATPQEAKFIIRTVTGQLRLGVAEYTVLDACIVAFLGNNLERKTIERAYSVHPDMGFVVETIAAKGLKGLQEIKVEIGVPIRPMLAERLDSAEAILNQMGNKKVAAEYKLDGERLQIHKTGKMVQLFSRRLEVITSHYPDAVDLAKSTVSSTKAILEAEVVAINEETGEYLPFQELMHRRRKYGIEDAMKQYPVALNFFDLLFAGGKDYTSSPYLERRKKLEAVVRKTDRTRPVPMIKTSDPGEMEKFMEDAITNGCEGLVVKDLGATYRAGAREFAWIKLKREYRSELADTIDLTIVGAFHGRGRRAETYGAFLLASYDSERVIFTTIAKIGTGFSDQDLEAFPKLLEPYTSQVKPANVESNIVPDVWFRPHVVIETIAAEITLSPTYTAAMNKIREGAGISLRFPKYTGKIRDDKEAEDSTTVAEVLEMYNRQRKKISPVQPAAQRT
jgi:DNA ligase-1